jgi:hypothetical protein
VLWDTLREATSHGARIIAMFPQVSVSWVPTLIDLNDVVALLPQKYHSRTRRLCSRNWVFGPWINTARLPVKVKGLIKQVQALKDPHPRTRSLVLWSSSLCLMVVLVAVCAVHMYILQWTLTPVIPDMVGSGHSPFLPLSSQSPSLAADQERAASAVVAVHSARPGLADEHRDRHIPPLGKGTLPCELVGELRALHCLY